VTYRNSTFRVRAASQTLGLVLLAALCMVPARAQQSTPGQTTSGQTTPGSATSVLPPPLLSPDDNQSQTEANPFSDSSADASSTMAPTGTTSAGTQSSVTGAASNPYVPLSAAQIYAVLDQQPDAIVELKSLMADLAQQQGISLDPDSITDQMLYSQIASSPELRANITTFMRARGYVTDADLASYAAAGHDDDLFSSLQSSQISGAPSNAGGSSLNPVPNDALAGTSTTGAGNLLYTPRPRGTARQNEPSEPRVLRRTAPYNMLALRDLYTQLPEQQGKLKRYGSDVFLRRDTYATNQVAPGGRGMPLDVPAGPDYVVGPGDTLTVAIWGGISQSLTRTIDRDGRLNLPDAGPVQVAGLTLERTQAVIVDALKAQYRSVQVAVTVARLRSIRVYVVGDVQRPAPSISAHFPRP